MDKTLLYQAVCKKIQEMIGKGTFRQGERIPSIRVLSREMKISPNTVMAAYAQLENMGLIEARPQSGFYVKPQALSHGIKRSGGLLRENLKPKQVVLEDTTLQVMNTISNQMLLPLGIGMPNPDKLPIEKLTRMLASESKRFGIQSISYADVQGIPRLRTQIAKRSFLAGCSLGADDIIITSGCIEAITLALQCVCRQGDTIAIGTPVHPAFLKFIQWMGLKILEIPSCPAEGINLDVLSYTIKQNHVSACIVIANFNNPLGSLMPEEKKQELVSLLERNNIPLIEDDIYGDLAFGKARPNALKAYEQKGLVLHCSSFSKTLAPGYRVGWIAPGKFMQKLMQRKSLSNIATASPTQLAIAEFLVNGGYDSYLRKVRRTYAKQIDSVIEVIGLYFPGGTIASRPRGGYNLWVELPEGYDTYKLYEIALQNGISIAPGMIFTLKKNFRHCFRINASYWSNRVEHGVEFLGKAVKDCKV
ncbi:helix-turn-helix transcriptional regulator with aminotransferase domain, GntR family [Syntrophotalea carbinolica DSM 2380]|uniref:Helix-turn-helix transcriptional regulator with aminotransferase domain, GntR family n=1 Tax=Syntrophotalea carbinolica (strain DSM 2380 / NBRC 103641 / GraBd1) TaxID=338963 RepID=Q3A464_SYNC1|nr:PLP-dependent aminotransferase family protein [Syntrophotalea carbinolica]ABA88843.1 helix-turn-helix transcriptional regulator with aminotransferase domain, GntR family [Syntrophotalea carbinolica DSM 2380]